ncbi:helix-turn-helix domain-containing protein [Pseudarthrobacter oxydans]|uniref:helix-turn-helix domain-containing protein n=1 Tax=Pseudarthrobacter oxydans TaxID=1671 RepID=UPI0034262C2B
MSQSKFAWMKSLRGADLTHAEYRVLVTISTYTNAGGTNAFPGFETIVRDSCTDPKTARKALRTLQEKGWLELVDEGGNKHWKGKANVYAIRTPAPKPKEGNDSLKGGTDSLSRGVVNGPPSEHGSDHEEHSDPYGSGSAKPSAPSDFPPDWEYNLDEVLDWLTRHLGIDEDEERHAWGMWEDEYHPKAIFNSVVARRIGHAARLHATQSPGRATR